MLVRSGIWMAVFIGLYLCKPVLVQMARPQYGRCGETPVVFALVSALQHQGCKHPLIFSQVASSHDSMSIGAGYIANSYCVVKTTKCLTEHCDPRMVVVLP